MKYNRAVIYARFSSHSQTEQSIEGQIDVCTKFARDNDLIVVGTYIDRAMTATNDKRPDFQKMLLDSSSNKFDYVIVYKLDRFSRNRYDSAINKAHLRKNNVKLLSACENITDTPEGIILESLLEGMNEYYSAELSQKVKRGQSESLKKGNFLGGKLTYGYKIENKKFVINKQEAEVVKQIFTDYSNGVSAKKIVNSLKSKNIQNNNNRFFVLNSIINLLKNKKYIGILTYAGIEYKNYLPAIIDESLFYAVQQKLKENKKYHGVKMSTDNYILSGKLYCGECECLMHGESGTGKLGKKYTYYKCCGKKKGSTKCRNKVYRKSELENDVIDSTKEILLDKDFLKQLINDIVEVSKKEAQENNYLSILKQKYNQLKSERDNIIRAIKNGINSTTLKVELEDLEIQILNIENELLIEQSKQPIELTHDILENWFNKFLTSDDKKTSELIINSLVNKIVLLDNQITIVYNNTNLTQKVADLSVNTMCSSKNVLVHP